MHTAGHDPDAGRGGTHATELPPFSWPLHGWFMWYVRRYLRRNFHALRLLRGADGAADRPAIADEPVVFYSNHPGWWDPITFLFTGHLHHHKSQEIGGMLWEQLPAITARDVYATSNAYTGRARLSGITYHRTRGEVSRVTIGPDA